LRRLIPLDWAIGSLSSRPLEAIDRAALAALRLGAYQVLFTRVPPHAAVGETVALADPRHRGFVNAILRALVRTPPEPPSGGDDRSISIRTGLSVWAVGELRHLLPEPEVERGAAALASRADLSIRTNPCVVDAVLVDAPCSGMGAARRRPELLWRPRREDRAGLARLQVGILSGAAGLVRPGGRLLYSVCTFPRAETDAAVRAFLTRCPGFEPA